VNVYAQQLFLHELQYVYLLAGYKMHCEIISFTSFILQVVHRLLDHSLCCVLVVSIQWVFSKLELHLYVNLFCFFLLPGSMLLVSKGVTRVFNVCCVIGHNDICIIYVVIGKMRSSLKLKMNWNKYEAMHISFNKRLVLQT